MCDFLSVVFYCQFLKKNELLTYEEIIEVAKTLKPFGLKRGPVATKIPSTNAAHQNRAAVRAVGSTKFAIRTPNGKDPATNKENASIAA